MNRKERRRAGTLHLRVRKALMPPESLECAGFSVSNSQSSDPEDASLYPEIFRTSSKTCARA
jgi:hypothetical protein